MNFDQYGNPVDSARSLSVVKEALAKAMDPGQLAKATFAQSGSATSGLTAYSLEAPAKLLMPVITPLRNKLSRATGGAGIQANWRAITGIDTSNIGVGVGEGRRGGVQAVTTADYFAQFRTLGIEGDVTFEAQLAAQGFDDAKARAVQSNLRALMIGEEKVILGGLGTFGLGKAPTPTLATAASGGTIAQATTVYVRVVALTLEGYMHGAAQSLATGIRAEVSRTNADGTSQAFGGGSSQASDAASQATAGSGGSVHVVSASVAPVKGAVAYAWYAGSTDGTAANLKLHAITTINSTVITALPAGGNQALPADLVSNDRSQNALVHDGFMSMVAKSGSGALWHNLATGTAGTGTPLTSDNAGGIVEIDYVLRWYWDNLKISPSEIWVNARELGSMRAKATTGASTSMQRFTYMAAQDGIRAGGMIRGYINQYSMDGAQEIPIKLHPNVPPGTILFLTHEIPYPLSGVGEVNRVLCRQDYYQMEWPLRTRSYEYGVYTDQVLQCYFLPGQAVISNIAAG
jgi:hypothetical protein